MRFYRIIYKLFKRGSGNNVSRRKTIVVWRYVHSACTPEDLTSEQKLIAQTASQFAMECSVCKVYSSEAFDTVVDEALQLHGGAGFIQDYEIESVYRDSRINRIFEGTNEINRLVLPMHFLRKSKKWRACFKSGNT
ncbi:acyl-CoA dehydrogenase family protein [Priestia flexa]|uniref:acyl-CoA dehydrogenase family protein n=1 Tax=Priestia flexa TaxID=86664 RepID=UPI001CD663E1|nr:acyl-CoA dehydrogenase family protein [Priestia flexa]MCA1202027.1 hypothetical protein [Priestia flexa]